MSTPTTSPDYWRSRAAGLLAALHVSDPATLASVTGLSVKDIAEQARCFQDTPGTTAAGIDALTAMDPNKTIKDTGRS